MVSPVSEHVIELRNCSRGFGRSQVLRDISVSVRRGETLVLIGESGCGKSVTTKLMASLLEPNTGTVLWDGTPLLARKRKQLQRDRLKLGYLFQGGAMFDSLNIYENVAFGLRQNQKLPESTIESVVDNCLRSVGLMPTVFRKFPSELSGGMRKRAALARVLAMQPEIIIYDEPTTGLDPVMSDVINELILRTREEHHVTSIVVTHDMTTVQRVANRVVMLYPLARLAPEEPQVIYEGDAATAFEHPDPRVRDFVRGDSRSRLQELFAA